MLAFIDERAPRDAVSALVLRGFYPVLLPPYSALGGAVASHTDMLIFRAGGTLIFHADYCCEHEERVKLIRELTKDAGLALRFISERAESKYPRDALLNALVMGNTVFCKTDTVAPAILEYAEAAGLRTVHVNQGYPACTVLKLSDTAAITSDRGMARALEGEGIRTTLISEGGIALPPYEHGFIGGAGGVFRDTVYFVGKIESHPSYNIIRKAAEREGLATVSLGSGGLLDVGGILFTD
ncbi:MAG: hypothetical protein IJW48_05420 [Clostridia bacterium]|nr:hypothetical protein [Clostridia bacterium]